MRKAEKIVLAIILLSFAIGIYLFPGMPEKMASHWNAAGEVDGYISRFWGVFLMPIVTFVIYLLFILIPKIDPLKKNIEKFRNYFDGFFVLMVLFFLYIYLLSVGWNLGYRFNMTQFIVPAVVVLFYYVGILTEKAKRNWFVGIRTPWTLSSDKVWDKTHKIGGKLFKISAVLMFMGIIFKEYMILFIIVPVLSTALFTIVYSYFVYKKEVK